MKAQVIEFVTLKENRTPFDNAEAFQLRKDRPAQWLQKTCLFVLRKLRAFHVEELVTVDRRVINSGAFIDRLFNQRKDIEFHFNMKPNTLLIGAEDYAELMNEPMAEQMFSFNSEYGFGREVFGMKVHVIPWMRGCLVLPNL